MIKVMFQTMCDLCVGTVNAIYLPGSFKQNYKIYTCRYNMII